MTNTHDVNMHGAAIEKNVLHDGVAWLPAPAANAIEVRIGHGINALLALQHDWTAIAVTRPDIRFHHSYGWYLSYLRNLEQDESSVHFFSFFRDGRPIAIFPLRRIRRRVVAGINLWLWELPRHPHMNLCDCIIALHENNDVLMHLLVATLVRRKDMPWDALHLPNLLEDAFALGVLCSGVLPRTLLARIGRSMYFPCDDLTSALCNTTGKFKRNLRRQRKKLDQRGRVELSLVQDCAALDEAFVAFMQLEASGWKGKRGRGSAIMLRPNLERFYQDLMENFAADERCLISLLKLDGHVIAAQFCVIAGTTLYLLKIAYDETFSAMAPGNQLLHDLLRHCCDSQLITSVSLVTVPAWAVGRWNPDAHDVWSAYVFNSSLRGIAAYAAESLRSAFTVAAKSMFRFVCAAATSITEMLMALASKKAARRAVIFTKSVARRLAALEH